MNKQERKEEVEKLKKKDYYSDCDIKGLYNSDIRELDITNIVAKSNFDDEGFSEYFIAKDIKPYFLHGILNYLDEKHVSSDSTLYIVACKSDYKLYTYEP